MFRIVHTHADFIKTLIVRGIVFMEEQKVCCEEEIDAHEFTAVHILGEVAGEPVAAARIRLLEDGAKFERIAVRPAYRGRGIGHDLVEYMIDVSLKNGVSRARMHAQAHLVSFYESHGFTVQGKPFEEAGITHLLMTREI
jgi:predicted GNAT family N-acyltransferase